MEWEAASAGAEGSPSGEVLRSLAGGGMALAAGEDGRGEVFQAVCSGGGDQRALKASRSSAPIPVEAVGTGKAIQG